MPAAVAVLGGGLAGCCTALALASRGVKVDLFEQSPLLIGGASLHNEGKLHLGYVYAADPECKTHALLAEGSISFLDIVERLTGSPASGFLRSRPFVYGVPHDSQLPPEKIKSHFEAVDATLHQLLSQVQPPQPGSWPRPARRLADHELTKRFNPAMVAGAFQTDEYSVDTAQIAAVTSAAVARNQRITVRLGTSITAVESGPDQFVLHCQSSTSRIRYRYPLVVNCLWHDRLRIDSMVKLTPSHPWLFRYKAAITFGGTERGPGLFSATLVLGAYGDVVAHADGGVYLSWYPACKLGESSALDAKDLLERVKLADRSTIVHESIEAMSHYIPSVGSLKARSATAKVGGGVICALGQTDIVDRSSGLHSRYQIGPVCTGNWISLDTGKYCMAPYFAEKVANHAIALLS